MLIKCLSVRLPWAELIMQGVKRMEFRTWKTSYRGPLLIVAAKKMDNGWAQSVNADKLRGKSLCIVQLAGQRKTIRMDASEFGFPIYSFNDKQYYSMLLSSRYLVNQIPIDGALGIFTRDINEPSIVEAWGNATKTYLDPPF